MKIMLYALLGFLMLILVIALIGALLPRSHTATREATFHQTPAALYAAASDFATQSSWREGLQSIEMLPPQDGHIRYREISGRRAVAYLVTENEPGKKLVTKIDDDSLPFGGAWTIEFLSVSGGTTVRITEQGEVKNVFFRFFSRFVFGYTASLDAYLRNLGKKFGESTVPQP